MKTEDLQTFCHFATFTCISVITCAIGQPVHESSLRLKFIRYSIFVLALGQLLSIKNKWLGKHIIDFKKAGNIIWTRKANVSATNGGPRECQLIFKT